MKRDDDEKEYELTPELISQKLDLFKELKSNVHIALKNGRWMNGCVIEIDKKKKFFVLKEFIYGETPLFFSEIVAIEPFKRKEAERGK